MDNYRRRDIGWHRKGGWLLLAVILCGGQGTRLRTVVPDLPKALAPIQGRPVLAYQIEWLSRSGFEQIVLCVGYRWEAIHAHFGDGDRYGVKLAYSVEQTPLGTAGCLKLAEPLISEPALVLNGDTLLSIAPAELSRYHNERGALVTLGVAPVPDASDSGSVTLDRQDRITSFREKESGAGLVSAGTYFLSPASLRYLQAGQNASLERDFLPALLAAGEPLFGYRLTGPFLDIGTPERYQHAQKGWVWP